MGRGGEREGSAPEITDGHDPAASVRELRFDIGAAGVHHGVISFFAGLGLLRGEVWARSVGVIYGQPLGP